MKQSELIEERRLLSREWQAIREDRERVERREANYRIACWDLERRIVNDGVEIDEDWYRPAEEV